MTTPAAANHTGGEATCTKLAVCSVCGKEYGELAPNNHKNLSIGTVFHSDGNGNHYQWRGCSDCKNAQIEKVNEAPCSDETTKDHKCDVCDATLSKCADDMTPTDKKPADCTTNGYEAFWTCDVCGKNYSDADATAEITDLDAWLAEGGDGYIPATGHGKNKGFYAAPNNDGTHNEHCGDCRAVTKKNVDCFGGTATCTAKAKCSACDTAYGEKNLSNHTSTQYNYTNDGKTHSAAYKCCGATYVTGEPHNYSYDAAKHECICGAVEMFVITLDANGGQFSNGAPIYPVTAEYGALFNAVPADPTRDGYQFTGWNTAADGTGDLVVVAPGTLSFTANITLYAQWSEKPACTHEDTKFVSNGDGTHDEVCKNEACNGYIVNDNVACSGGEATCQAKAVCEKCNTAYGELDKTNHTSDEEKYIQFGDSHAVVYACCNAHKRGENHTYDKTTHRCVCGALEKFTITLNANGGKFNSGAVAIDVSGEYGTDFTAIPEMPTKDGSALIGWTDESGNTIVLGEYKFTENITVYAQWCDHTKTTATDNGDGTHTVKCLCGATSYSEDHSYDKTPGTCVCGVKLTGWIDNSYYENGEKVTGWKEVDGAWYYFGENGYCTGLRRLPYLTELGYKPNQKDIDYAANKGTAFKDATEAWFYFDQDGKLMTGFTGILDGKYVENGMIPWHPGFVQVEGEWYYFVGDAENGGNKMANGQIYVTRNAEAAGYETGDQIVFVNGQVDTTVDGIVDKEGVLYYYESGKLMAGNGLTKIGDKYIYVCSSGKLAVGEYYIPANDLGVVSALYTFDANGYMVMPKYTDVNGVVDGYYYKDGKVQYGAGLIEWNGDIYYVRSNGQVATGWYYVTNVNEMEGFQKGMKLNFGEDGKLQPVKNGIVEENDELYYYENNHMMCGAGLLKLEDENGVYYIYVRSSGKVQTGYFYITKTNDLEGFEAGMKLNFGEDGKYYPGK